MSSKAKRSIEKYKLRRMRCVYGVLCTLSICVAYFICRSLGGLDLSDFVHEKSELNLTQLTNDTQRAFTLVEVFNLIGNDTSRGGNAPDLPAFSTILEKSGVESEVKSSVLERMSAAHRSIENDIEVHKVRRSAEGSKKTRITIATIACSGRAEEALTMLKSAALFSQDSALHVVVYSDNEAMRQVAEALLKLKWTVNSMGWNFTFELHHDSFPVVNKKEWKEMYRKCASQRLFFPMLLPHIDSLLYLDSDVIVVSNLTELWSLFGTQLKTDKMVASAPNNEPTVSGWYYKLRTGNKNIPYYGPRGLNTGIMLMNLTQMRQFKFQDKAMATYTIYKEKILLADQDIVNIIFARFPEKVYPLDCTYNFYWVHCGNQDDDTCYNKTTGVNMCYCTAIQNNGVRIVHGNYNSFHANKFYRQAFLPPLYDAFLKVNLLKGSYSTIFEDLKKQFDNLKPSPCDPLTSDGLYRNALSYLQKLK